MLIGLTESEIRAFYAEFLEADVINGGFRLKTNAELGLNSQATLEAILAKIIAAPATEAKQDVLNAKDFATQATLAAILAKIIAAPATEAKQDTGNSSLATIQYGNVITANSLIVGILGASNAAEATALSNAMTSANADIQAKVATGHKLINHSHTTILNAGIFTVSVTLTYSKA